MLKTTRGATEEGEEREEDGDEGQEVLRGSVYRLWFINSRAVSKSSRSSESLWIGAKKMHLLKSPYPLVQKTRLINDFMKLFSAPLGEAKLRVTQPSFLNTTPRATHKGIKDLSLQGSKVVKQRERDRTKGTGYARKWGCRCGALCRQN